MPAAGADRDYNGEWAGPWEQALIWTVDWTDANLPTIASADGRVLAGLSAGGFGAMDIGLRHPSVFGRIEAWSGYFQPLLDGRSSTPRGSCSLRNDPTRLAVSGSARCSRRRHTRFFVSSGPAHSHWFRPTESVDFARELRSLGLPAELRLFPDRKGEWRAQLDAGLAWAFPA